ncbi:hypothetical protein F5148DRAFT_1250601 [Russula earlei]|uniref:Uncharacterized protein n=1 Tax=Russula earlei TaxID=71964 RepID=A0ACC0TTM1_9AGAM|nr:hypothetical protein F5148DRAFT_1250601 [Russula earlei]
MRTSPVFVIFCLAVGIAPSFALPLEVRNPDPVLHTRGLLHSSTKKKDQTNSSSPKTGQTDTQRTLVSLGDYTVFKDRLPLSEKEAKRYGSNAHVKDEIGFM